MGKERFDLCGRGDTEFQPAAGVDILAGCLAFSALWTYLAGPKVENAMTLIPYASHRSIKSCWTCVKEYG
jgi:hypothetical protein